MLKKGEVVVRSGFPVVPVIPPDVAPGETITAGHTNAVNKALADLWTDLQTVGGGGPGAVSSVFGRTGAVVAKAGDYSAAMVGAVDVAGEYANPAFISSLAWGKITGAPAFLADPTTTKGDLLARGAAAVGRLPLGGNGQVLTVDGAAPLGVKWSNPAVGGVSSVFGRSGVVVAQAGDYSADMITEAVSTGGSYINPPWIVTLAWDKIVGDPGQTPFRSDIDGSGYALTNVGRIQVQHLIESLFDGFKFPDGSIQTKAAAALPLSAKGDLLVYSSALARLPVGTDGQVLTADAASATGVKWATPSAGGGSQTPWTSDIDAANHKLGGVTNLGIGSAAAGYPFYLLRSSGGGSPMMWIQSNVSSDNVQGLAVVNSGLRSIQLWMPNSGYTTIPNVANNGCVFVSQGDLVFLNSGPTERMRMNGNGYLGLMISNPQYRIDCAGDINTTGDFRRNGTVVALMTEAEQAALLADVAALRARLDRLEKNESAK